MWLALTLLTACREDPGALRFDGDTPSNVLMVSIDTLRRDAVGHYNPAADDTPFLDGMLAEAFTLEDHRSCSNWTYGAVVCAMTGRSGPDVGFIPGSWDAREPVPESVGMLPGWLRGAGYRTALSSSNFYVGSTSGITRDFDHIFQEHEGRADGIVDNALRLHEDMVTLDSGTPWFLHAHFFDPHAGYDAPESYLGDLEGLAPSPVDVTDGALVQTLEDRWEELTPEDQALTLEHMRIRYAAEVRYLDDQLKRLFEDLDSRGALEDTLVVIWSDHGEQFGEHGAFDHGKTLYGEELAATAAFWSRDIVPGAWTGPSEHEDLAPTLMSALGLERPQEVIGAALGVDDSSGPRFAMRRNEFHLQSVDDSGDRLMYWWEDGRLALYDIEADPGEMNDLYDPSDPKVQALWALLKPRVEAAREFTEGDAPPVWPPEMP